MTNQPSLFDELPAEPAPHTGSTYRDRRLRKAERLRGWAEKREARAESAFDRAGDIADSIPFGQPILKGHHSQRRAERDQERIEAGMRAGIDHSRTAERMRERADNIERAAEAAIYSDDPDAPERLAAKIAGLEADRLAIKAYNKSCRAGYRDLSLLTPQQQTDLRMIARVASFQIGPHGEYPSYGLSNLSGNINRLKKRLAELS